MFNRHTQEYLEAVFDGGSSFAEKRNACIDLFYASDSGLCCLSSNESEWSDLPWVLRGSIEFSELVLSLLALPGCGALLLASFGVHLYWHAKEALKSCECDDVTTLLVLGLGATFLLFSMILFPKVFVFGLVLGLIFVAGGVVVGLILWNLLVLCELIEAVLFRDADSFPEKLDSLLDLIFGKNLGFSQNNVDTGPSALNWLVIPYLFSIPQKLFPILSSRQPIGLKVLVALFSPVLGVLEAARLLIGGGLFLVLAPLALLSHGMKQGNNDLKGSGNNTVFSASNESTRTRGTYPLPSYSR